MRFYLNDMKVAKIESKLTELKTEIKDTIFNSKTKEEIIWLVARFLDKRLVEIGELLNEENTDGIKDALGDDVFVCTRSWDAWQTGTMTIEDFKLASDDDDLINSIDNAVS